MAPSVQLVQVECLSDDHFSGESDRAGGDEISKSWQITTSIGRGGL